MTETYSGELSYEAKRALSRLFPLIAQWRKRMESTPTPPEPGSSLLKDDQAVHPYLVSQAVSAQFVSAADHWDALRALLQDAQIVHARAPFTLLRAAIENSAAAVWLLAPTRRDIRGPSKLAGKLSRVGYFASRAVGCGTWVMPGVLPGLGDLARRWRAAVIRKPAVLRS
jgi:hypothetical protein